MRQLLVFCCICGWMLSSSRKRGHTQQLRQYCAVSLTVSAALVPLTDQVCWLQEHSRNVWLLLCSALGQGVLSKYAHYVQGFYILNPAMMQCTHPPAALIPVTFLTPCL